MAEKIQADDPVVLIVENHSLLRRLMRDFLQSVFPGWSFREAVDGAAALRACHAHRPQLVLLDTGLPDVNEIKLTARMRTLYPGIEVIVVSQGSSEVYVEQALAAGARACVCKAHIATRLAPAVAAAICIAAASVTGTSS